jgi:5'-methylthioadenosine phosphorylase
MIIGIIGGSGVTAAILEEMHEARTVTTAFGEAEVTLGTVAGQEMAFLPRHGGSHRLLPHQINYRANALALASLGITRVFATSAVGSLRDSLPPGSLALLTDFLDFTRARPGTLAAPGDASPTRFHVDMADPYCPALREMLATIAAELGLDLAPAATYVCVEGPRYETHAEIRMFQTLGADLVGMTGVPEVTLARELSQCYASVAIVTNMAAGLVPHALNHDDVEARVAEIRSQVVDLLRAVVPRAAAVPGCPGHGR